MAGNTQLISIDQADSLQKTNPELKLYPYAYRAETGIAFNTQIKPWNDIRVRRAIQMGIDYEAINKTYFKGWANTTPVGHIGYSVIGYYKPYAEWPEEIKQYYRYDPEGSSELNSVIYLKRIIFWMIFEKLHPIGDRQVVPVIFKSWRPKQVAYRIEHHDMGFCSLYGFVSHFILREMMIFCSKSTGFRIPVQ